MHGFVVCNRVTDFRVPLKMMTILILLLLLSIAQLAVTQQCNQYQFDTPFFPGTSCEDIYNKNPQSRDMSGYYWILDGPSKVYCGMNYTGPTCEDIYLNNEAPRDKPGYYRNSSNYWTFCDMNLTRSELFSLGLVSFGSGSGVAGVWRRIANFNISAGDDCPSPWMETTYNNGNYCVPADTNRGCYSVFFSTNGTSYQQVSGRGSVYAKDTLDGFWPSANTNAGTDSYYVDGLSITHGDPRQHIWTLLCFWPWI